MKYHPFFFRKLGKMLQNLSSAAVVICSLRVNFLSMILSMSLQELKEIKDYYRKGKDIRIYHEYEDGSAVAQWWSA